MNSEQVSPTLVRTTIFFCALTALCEGIDLQAAGVAAAGIGAEFMPRPDQMGTFFSASTFGLFIGAIFGGRIADSIGRKAVLTASVGLFGLFSLATAFAWDMRSLTAARFLTGLGLGGALPMMLAYVSETARAGRQSASVAMVYALTPFGGAVVSAISLTLTAAQWRTIFIIGGIVPLVVAGAMMAFLKESQAFRRDVTGASSLKRGSFAAIFAEGRGLRTVLLWVSFLLALLLLYLLLNWLPTLLISDGLTRRQSAGAQIGFNIGGALAAVALGRILEGRFRNLGVTVVFVALPLMLVVLAKAPADLITIMAIVFVLGCVVMAAQTFLYAMAPGTYPTLIRGVGVGMAVAMGRIGSIIGPWLGGTLKAAGHGPARLLMDLLPIVVLGSICALTLAWFTRPSRKPA
jgi:MFS transporter, AAHS family, 3-hydroxyphenylpropionic acid transporter